MTQNAGVNVSKLSDEQLAQELASAERQAGIQSDRRSALLAINTDPRYVVVGASTEFSGTFNGKYNADNRKLYGSFEGSGYTTYHYADVNAGARFRQNLGLLFNNLNTAALESRRKAVLTEISKRRQTREAAERTIQQFWTANPEIAAKQDLLTACLLITRHRASDTLGQLQQAAEIMRTLPSNRWIGWVEAHGDPEYPYGVVAGSYVMDTFWNGDTLSGKGKGSDGLELTLTAKKTGGETIEGTVHSKVMEAKFHGRMTDNALCIDYAGTNSGHPIRGITWAFR